MLQATHNLGGYIYSTHSSGTVYELSLITYSDPSVANVDRCSATMEIWRIDSTQTIVATLNDIPRVNGPIDTNPSVDCPLIASNTGEFIYGNFKKNLYQFTYNFQESGKYEIRFSDKNRAINVINIPDSENQSLYVGLTLQVDTGVVDNSPIFLNEGVLDHTCVGSTWTHNPGIFDPDGDSLVVSLRPAWKYDPPTLASPIPANDYRFPDDTLFGSSILVLDTLTGFMIWEAPQQAGNYVLVYQVDTYRSGNLTASTFREISIIVSACSLNPPVIRTTYPGCFPAGDSSQIAIQVYDPDLSDSLFLGLNNAGQGNNGPFSALSSQAPTVFGEVIDRLNGFVFNSLPVSTQNNGPGTAPDTVKATLNWVPDCSDMNKQFQLDIFARDDKVSFQSKLMRTDHELLTLKVIPPSPRDLQVLSTNPAIIELAWDAPPCPVQEYLIYRRIDSSGWNSMTCGNEHPTDFGFTLLARKNPSAGLTFTDIPAGQMNANICYVITAVFAGDLESNASMEVCVNNYTTSIDNPIESPIRQISPNPATQSVFISLREAPYKPLSYSLYSIDGKRWKTGKLFEQEQQVSLSGLPAGVYFLQLETGVSHRILKISTL